MTKSRWLLVAVAVVCLALLMAMCTPSGGAEALTIDTEGPTGPRAVAFTLQADSLAPRNKTSCAHQWGFTQGWYSNNVAGLRLYTFGLDTRWCSGARMRKVTSLVYLHCYDLGHGGATYLGCDKDVGSTGFESLGTQVHWHYKIFLPVAGDLKYYNPHLSPLQLHANGAVTGTIYYW